MSMTSSRKERPEIDPEDLPGPAVIIISGPDPESRKRPRPETEGEST